MAGDEQTRIADPMPHLPRFAAFLVAVLFSVGCARSEGPASEGAVASTAGATPLPKSTIAPTRSLVTTITLEMVVEDVDRASTSIREEVERLGGFVSSASARRTDDGRSAVLVLRIPADKVRAMRGKLAGTGELTNDTEHVEDVTEERADLDARLRNARVEERRIVDLMRERTGTIADVLESEKELARVREIIERHEAQQRSLHDTIDLATIHLSLARRNVPAWQTPAASIARAGGSGARAAAAFGTYAAMAAAATAPFFVPIGSVVLLLVVAQRRRQRRMFAG